MFLLMSYQRLDKVKAVYSQFWNDFDKLTTKKNVKKTVTIVKGHLYCIEDSRPQPLVSYEFLRPNLSQNNPPQFCRFPLWFIGNKRFC